MIVCIAEKPAVAREIAKVLGATVAHDGYMEGNGYQVTWTFGHLCTLKEPHDYLPAWKQWTFGALPIVPPRFGIKLIENDGYKKQFDTIVRLFAAADSIVNCGDAGQEGELIQRWVMQKAGARCPVQRLWVSSLTEEAIRQGFASLKPQQDYQSLYEAALCRAIGDWLLGMNATRIYTLKYRSMRGQVFSVGRVQTPTLALIVNRQHEIDTFVPEPYWVLATRYRDVLFTSTVGKYKSEDEGRKVFLEISDKPFKVEKVSLKEGTEAPPRLLDLTSLQVECNKKYAYSADQTLKHIQSLYEKKLTTYPRVDTTYLPDDVYPQCPAILQGIRPYAHLVQPLMGRKLKKSKKVFDNSKITDHHAIIPTGQDPSTVPLSAEEKRVYDLVARHFIAVFYPDCKSATTTIVGTVEKHQFKATGKQILDPGWRDVFPTHKDSTEETSEPDDEKTLPHMEEGEEGPHTPVLSAKQTTPPKPYTEATLLRAMETAGKFVTDDELRDALKENGIGRPSTRAAIIETLFRRNYIVKERKNLRPTPDGIRLLAKIDFPLLKSPELTGQWERKLRQIESQKYSPQQFIEELKAMVSDVVNQVKTTR